MLPASPYRTLTAYELVEAYMAHKAGENWSDPRTTPITVEQWTQNLKQD